MHEVGVISTFFIFYKKRYYIKFASFFYKNAPFFKKIKTVSTAVKIFYIDLNTLQLVNKVLKQSVLILSTNKGLLTHQKALFLGVGGKILYLVN